MPTWYVFEFVQGHLELSHKTSGPYYDEVIWINRDGYLTYDAALNACQSYADYLYLNNAYAFDLVFMILPSVTVFGKVTK